MDSERFEAARAKLVQLFKYLQAFNQLQNPVECHIDGQSWSLRLGDLPRHESIRLTSPEDADDSKALPPVHDSELEPFELRVRKPVLRPCPPPPEIFGAWLEDQEWRSVDGSVALLSERTSTNGDGTPATSRFEEDSRRVAALSEWRSKRDVWAATERLSRSAMHVYEDLYRLQAQLDRDFEQAELMLGDGVLSWDRGGSERLVRHPVLLQKVELSFDPNVPEFTITDSDSGPELYTALLRSLSGIQAASVQRCIAELDKEGWHPLGGDGTSGFLKRMTNYLGPSAEYAADGTPEPKPGVPRIGRDAMLFLRRRTLGFNTAIDEILRNLATAPTLPESIVNIVGIEPSRAPGRGEAGISAAHLAVNGEDEDILLGKEANAEQLEIAKRLKRHGAVLVQGPPGTGKTHTIANLIGHILSEGKRVLVTSQTAKALKVLRDHVVEPLQPLCVSVSSGGAKQLETAVDEITDRLASSDKDALSKKADALAKRRQDILVELGRAREELLTARTSEYTPVIVAGQSCLPVEAAKYVAEHQSASSWIPAPVVRGQPLPLSEAEVRDLYASNCVPVDQESEATLGLPDIAALLTPSDFRSLCISSSELSCGNFKLGEDLWVRNEEVTPDRLRSLLVSARQAVSFLRERDEWLLAAVGAGAGEGLQVWEELLDLIRTAVRLSHEAAPAKMKHQVTLPSQENVEDVVTVLENVETHLRCGGTLGLPTLVPRPTWRRILQSSSIDGHRPRTVGEVQVLTGQARLGAARFRLASRWGRQMVPLGAEPCPAADREPEVAVRGYVETLEQALNWFPNVWLPIEREFRICGLKWQDVLAATPLQPVHYSELVRLRAVTSGTLREIVEAQARRLELWSLQGKSLGLTRALEGTGASTVEGSATSRLLLAVRGHDPDAYQAAYDMLLSLHQAKERLSTRAVLLAKLEPVAQGWAEAVRNRKDVHAATTPPGLAAEAWLWRQYRDELEARAGISLSRLQERIAQLSADLREATAQLIETRAWAAQIDRTTLEQRQALSGWKQLTMKAGKRTGKRAPRLLAEARRLMPTCQSAVPVWIMPLSLVVESFNPSQNRFDVVIIDEASQANILALVALYLGDQVVVVGDHEQVSPEAVGQKISDVQQIIDMYLPGIPNRALYDGQTSIYHLAQTSFGGAVMLREHFRCVPQIIQFSNHLSYGGKIQPLRDDSLLRVRPATVAYQVTGTWGSREGNRAKSNPLEARTTAALLIAASREPEYGKSTFGVISLVGGELAMMIDSLLQRHMDPGEYFRRKVQCGNAAQFQGDERDVVFLSMVDTPRDGGPLPLRPDPGDRFKKRFNVAASRARDQLWVVHAVDPDIDLKPEDLRRRLILHARNPEAITALLAQQEARADSEFERLVLRRLVEAGYRVTAQRAVGAYRIDLVVEGGGRRLAIECDGDRWHTTENLAQDMQRQMILERLGWSFLRIRGSQFYQDPESTMRAVLKRLEAFGIVAEGPTVSAQGGEAQSSSLKDRVIRSAAQLLAEWGDGEGYAFPTYRPQAAIRRDSGPRPPGGANGKSEPPEMDPRYVVIGTNPRVTGAVPEARRKEVARDHRQPEPPGTAVQVTAPSAPARIIPGERSAPAAPAPGTMSAACGRESGGSGDDLLEMLSAAGLEFVDNRTTGGALWVIGGQEISSVITSLAEQGYAFTFSPAGGRKTGHRPAWWSSGAGNRTAR